MLLKSIATVAALLCLPGLVPGQIISVKTIPLITTQQFTLAPTYNAGMGGVSIAIDDPLADGFLNPARLTALDRNMLYTAPYQDGWRDGLARDPWNGSPISRQGGQLQGSQAQAIPLGIIRHIVLGRGDLDVITALAFSIERLHHASHRRQFQDPDTWEWNGPLQMSAFNLPLSAMVAVRLPRRGLSIGAGVDAVKIRGVDGVPMLYPGATQLRQDGSLVHYKLGASLTGTDGSRLDGLLLHRRYQMEQVAIYDWQDNIKNKDEEQSWLVQLKGRLPVEDQAQVGLALTGQWKWHPKLPDYPAPQIAIPRDPGITKAGRVGLGFSQRVGRLRAALDVEMELIDSRTWGDTTAPVAGVDGQLIAAGEPLFRNDYILTNAAIRLGFEFQIHSRLRVQGGWSNRQTSIDYFHEDFVTGEKITDTPHNWWKEPALTAGLVARVGPTEWILHTRRQYGTGRPIQGQIWWPWWGREGALLANSDLLVPPTGMVLQNAPVVMHQLSMIFWF